MDWKQVKVEYFSDNTEKTKEIIVNILKNIGIKEFQFEDDYTIKKLDFHRLDFTPDIKSVISYVLDNEYYEKKIDIVKEELEIKSEENSFIFNIVEKESKEEDWINKWKQFFTTSIVGEKVIVKPSWENYEKEEDEIVIELDPGQAFGTGTHPTTSLCIRMLEKEILQDKSVLDYGCGSGILMIVASKLGAKKISGIDIDATALEVSKQNLESNNIYNYNLYLENEILRDENKYDIIVSNIIIDILVDLLENIMNKANKDSKIILSGILYERKHKLLEILNDYNLFVEQELIDGEWISYLLKIKE